MVDKWKNDQDWYPSGKCKQNLNEKLLIPVRITIIPKIKKKKKTINAEDNGVGEVTLIHYWC